MIIFIIFLFSANLSCGFANELRSYSKDIVGGDDIDISKVPFQVSLQISGSHNCGGTIISSTYIVTAAHCVAWLEGLDEDLTVRAGTSIREEGGVVVDVVKFYPHPEYSDRTGDNDIAILELSSPLPLGYTIALADLPNKELPVGTDVLITGWGLLNETDFSLPRNLQGATVQIVSHETCEINYRDVQDITKNMLCAGVDGGGKDSCQDDSGGPLSANGTLYGVVSFGVGCAEARYPGVYADVLSLRSFIKEITGL